MTAATTRVLRRIAVLGNYGNLNLGDEATLEAVCQFIRQRCPGAVVRALSEYPEETRRRHGIEAAPSAVDARSDDSTGNPARPQTVAPDPAESARGRLKATLKRVPGLFGALRTVVEFFRLFPELWRQLRFLASSLCVLWGVDLLVVAGGGQLSDHFVGVWGFPFQLFSFCLLARCAGARVAVLNVGAGPISQAASRVLFRWTLRLADYRSYRDQPSRRLIESIGLRNAGPVGPDLVFGWEATADLPPYRPATTCRTVGLNVFPYKDRRYWPLPDSGAYAAYIDKICGIAHWLLAQGYRVRFFPTQLRADPRVITDVLDRLTPRLSPPENARVEIARPQTVEDLAREIRKMDVIIATRFHAIVIAMLMDKPVLGLCNESKMTELMADMGQAAYSLSLDALDVSHTIARFTDLEANREHVISDLSKRVQQARHTLEAQVETVFGPPVLTPPATAARFGDDRARAPQLGASTPR